MEKYRAHGYRRKVDDPPPLWESGPVRLRDYGVTAPAAENGIPVLVIPSLINRGYILDLTDRQSFLRFLAKAGFRPLLVDWGTPDNAWLARPLDAIIGDDLRAMLGVAGAIAGDAPVPVLGYCMGGTMAVGLAALDPERVSALALLAAPWNFHADANGPPPFVTAGRPALEALMTTLGCLPTDALQALFLSIDPMQGWEKFRSLGRSDPASPSTDMFVALEDWLNDGVPLGAAVARECLFGWYGENRPANNTWTVAGRTVMPGELRIESLAVIPARDRIVPPESAAALAEALPVCHTLSLAAGHIGMMVGGRARTALWQPVAEWLHRTEH